MRLKARNTIKGFTLAEVLITLTIIGVIAALTIPALITSIQDAQYHTAWKKEYSDLSAATSMIYSKYGDLDLSSNGALRDQYGSVMPYVEKNITSNLATSFYKYYKTTSNTGLDYKTWTLPYLKLVNGALVMVSSYGASCNTVRGNVTTICGYFRVDVNGEKPPNMYGKDFYLAWILKKNGGYIVYPMGNDDSKKCISDSTVEDDSQGCAINVLMNGSMP